MKQKPIRSPKHLTFVRQQPCMIKYDGLNCNRESIAHHPTFLKGKRGMGQKVSDEYAIPICHFHHYNLHYIGEKFFWNGHDIGLDEVVNYGRELWDITNK